MDVEHDLAVAGGQAHVHRAARIAVLDGIADEVGHHLRQTLAVPVTAHVGQHGAPDVVEP